ncbi:MAG: hypothetical protein NVSMB6_18990 [Burkholderiaceae bacterium]
MDDVIHGRIVEQAEMLRSKEAAAFAGKRTGSNKTPLNCGMPNFDPPRLGVSTDACASNAMIATGAWRVHELALPGVLASISIVIQSSATGAVGSSLFDTLQTRGMAILEQTEALARRLNALASWENQKIMLEAFGNVSRAAIGIEAIPRQLKPALEGLPQLSSQAQKTLASISILSKSANALAGSFNTLATQLQAPGGALQTFAVGADRVGSVARQFELEMLPLGHDAQSTLRRLNRALDDFSAHPQGLLFGAGRIVPGPGETGSRWQE